jgi:hypothetical protein
MFLNLNKYFQILSVNFHIQKKTSKLKCPFLDSINNFQTKSINL